MRRSGFAMVEGAVFLAIVVTIALVGAGMWDLLDRQARYREIVDRHLFDDGMKPLRLEAGVNGEIIARVDDTRIERRLQDMVSALEHDVKPLIMDAGEQEGGGYIIEAAYALVEINPETGVFERLSIKPFRATVGSLSGAPSSVEEATDLPSEFRNFTSIHDGSGVSTLAIPTALLGTGTSGPRYVDTSVLVGLRTIASLKKGAASWLDGFLGERQFVYDSKVITLRGDFQ